MGIRTYINAYKPIGDFGCHCMGKTDLLQNWLTDNLVGGDLYQGEIMLGEWERNQLLEDIEYVLNAENKRKAFDEKFRESDYYTDYDSWFEDALDTLKNLHDWLSSLEDDLVLFAGQW